VDHSESASAIASQEALKKRLAPARGRLKKLSRSVWHQARGCVSRSSQEASGTSPWVCLAPPPSRLKKLSRSVWHQPVGLAPARGVSRSSQEASGTSPWGAVGGLAPARAPGGLAPARAPARGAAWYLSVSNTTIARMFEAGLLPVRQVVPTRRGRSDARTSTRSPCAAWSSGSRRRVVSISRFLVSCLIIRRERRAKALHRGQGGAQEQSRQLTDDRRRWRYRPDLVLLPHPP
jgi:hypothetical protein